MSDIVIKAENLGKQFHIGSMQKYDTLRDRLAGTFKRKTENGKRKTDEDSFWALKDINFEIKQGEVVGVIGRNGAGKSTLLKILSKITEPTVGRVELHGRVGSLLEVGTGFHPELTGRENVFLNGAILGMSRAEITRKFDEIVAFSGVDRFIDTPVKHYSSGMYVRLAFSVAAHLEPEILLIDEVLSVGDFKFQEKCLKKIQNLLNSGVTVIFISHDLEAVEQICKRCIYLNKGRIVFNGNSTECINKYLNDKIEIETTEEKIAIYLIDQNNNIVNSINENGQMFIKIEYTDELPDDCFVNYSIGSMKIHKDLHGSCHITDKKAPPLNKYKTKNGYTFIVKADISSFLPGHYYLACSVEDKHGKILCYNQYYFNILGTSIHKEFCVRVKDKWCTLDEYKANI